MIIENGKILKKVGKKIKEAREKKGIKQTDLAQMLECAQSALHYWENGKKAPSILYIKKIEKVLGVKL